MRRHIKIIAVVLVPLAGLAYMVMMGFVTRLTRSAPAAWHQIHVGMHRSNILELVGPAQAGMYPEKIVETWYRDGALGIRKLAVSYQSSGDDRATMVREFVYWRPSQRHIYTRKEP